MPVLFVAHYYSVNKPLKYTSVVHKKFKNTLLSCNIVVLYAGHIGSHLKKKPQAKQDSQCRKIWLTCGKSQTQEEKENNLRIVERKEQPKRKKKL